MTGSADPWLERFAALVRARDVSGALLLFSPDVAAFGTRVNVAFGLDELLSQQWEPIWTSTRDFDFDTGGRWEQRAGDGDLLVVACTWMSQGFDDDATPFPRRGRATVALARSSQNDTGWVAVHTHFSESPTAW